MEAQISPLLIRVSLPGNSKKKAPEDLEFQKLAKDLQENA